MQAIQWKSKSSCIIIVLFVTEQSLSSHVHNPLISGTVEFWGNHRKLILNTLTGVCMCMRVCTCVYVCVYTCVCTCTQARTHIFMYITSNVSLHKNGWRRMYSGNRPVRWCRLLKSQGQKICIVTNGLSHRQPTGTYALHHQIRSPPSYSDYCCCCCWWWCGPRCYRICICCNQRWWLGRPRDMWPYQSFAPFLTFSFLPLFFHSLDVCLPVAVFLSVCLPICLSISLSIHIFTPRLLLHLLKLPDCFWWNWVGLQMKWEQMSSRERKRDRQTDWQTCIYIIRPETDIALESVGDFVCKFFRGRGNVRGEGGIYGSRG